MGRSLLAAAAAACAIAAAACAIVFAGAAAAADGPGPGDGSPPFAFVVGAGTFGDTHVTLSAHLGPNGPSGHYTIDFAGERFMGPVTCMKVDGNRAVAGGPFGEPFFFDGLLIENAGVLVEDNGEGGPVPDRARGTIFLPTTFARLCDPTQPLGSFGTFPLETGNFVVNPG
jgi:hypothetical protein